MSKDTIDQLMEFRSSQNELIGACTKFDKLSVEYMKEESEGGFDYHINELKRLKELSIDIQIIATKFVGICQLAIYKKSNDMMKIELDNINK